MRKRRYEGFGPPEDPKKTKARKPFSQDRAMIVSKARAGAASVKRRGSLIRPNPARFID